MHLSLGNTSRGQLAGALTAVGAALLSAWNGATTWHEAIGVIFGVGVVLGAALIDPGSNPPKPTEPPVRP